MKYFSAVIPAYFAKFKGILVIKSIYIILSRTKHFHSKMTYSNFEYSLHSNYLNFKFDIHFSPSMNIYDIIIYYFGDALSLYFQSWDRPGGGKLSSPSFSPTFCILLLRWLSSSCANITMVL